MAWAFMFHAHGQITLSGSVKDAQTGESLPYAQVWVPAWSEGSLTNDYGFFSLTLNDTASQLCVRASGYQTACVSIDRDSSYRISLMPQSKAYALDTIQVQELRPTSQQAGHLVVPVQQLARMPALLGEADALKGLQLLPGVQFGVEGTAGLYIRGGTPDQNLILLDEIPVYNVSHLFGFFSLFPPDALKSVELYRGGFPARYGGRLSSVIKLQTKDGNQAHWEKSFSLGILSGSTTLQGPLVKGKSSIFLTARRSWIDLLMRPLSRESLSRQDVNGSFGYDFYDFIGKVNYEISDRSRLFLSFYGGRDRNGLAVSTESQTDNRVSDNQGELRWGNLTGSLRLNHLYSDKLFSNTTLGYTQYRFRSWLENNLFENEQRLNYTRFEQSSLIRDWIFKHTVEFYPSPRHQWQMGLDASRQALTPDVQVAQTFLGNSLRDTSFNDQVFINYLAAAFVEHGWRPDERWHIQTGLRAEWAHLQGQSFVSLQPRVNAELALNPRMHLKGSYAYVRQYLHLLSSSGLALPADLWAPATPHTPPSRSHQGSLGLSYYWDQGINFSVEAYYKTMDQVVAYRDGADYYGTFDNWENQIVQGSGKAYGLEFFVHKPTGRFNGWLSYTLSRSTRQFEDINQGEPFPFRFDRPHNFSLNLSYALNNPNRRIGLTWMYTSGARITVPERRYDTPRDIQDFMRGSAMNPITLEGTYGFYNAAFNATERNNFSMTPFHKLDLVYAATKEKKGHQRTWTFGIYNLYGQRNALYVFFDGSAYYDENTERYDPRGKLTEYSFLMWIPAIGYRLEF